MRSAPGWKPRPNGARSVKAFTLVEIMIVAAAIAILAAIAIPGFMRSRKRSQAVTIMSDLRLIDAAVDQYAMENTKPEYSLVPVIAWKQYIKPGSRLYTTGQDILGQPYGPQTVGVYPTVPSSTWDDLIDVANSSFWTPYSRGN
jgi:prepilin-type N-terminal cleavage/methylation domain-containing protein